MKILLNFSNELTKSINNNSGMGHLALFTRPLI